MDDEALARFDPVMLSVAQQISAMNDGGACFCWA